MKKLPILLFFCSIALFVACKKDYTCTCRATTTIAGFASDDTTYTIPLGKQKKKDAQKKCDAYDTESSATYQGITVTSKTACDI